MKYLIIAVALVSVVLLGFELLMEKLISSHKDEIKEKSDVVSEKHGIVHECLNSIVTFFRASLPVIAIAFLLLLLNKLTPNFSIFLLVSALACKVISRTHQWYLEKNNQVCEIENLPLVIQYADSIHPYLFILAVFSIAHDINSDFSFLLFIGVLVTGIVFLGYVYYLKMKGLIYDVEVEPAQVELARSFFPVILIVLLLRSFDSEPFRIPSNSMMPTLLTGDFILVDKFAYGVRLPVINKKIIETGNPHRGDIVVFRYPKNPEINYIKRLIGLPHDKITYQNKRLTVNGQAIPTFPHGSFNGIGNSSEMNGDPLFLENLTGVEHQILNRNGVSSVEFTYTVPEGKYFMMGDNRDNSNDSRYWGTVPEENLVGKAFFIWMNWDFTDKKVMIMDFSRIGNISNHYE